MNKTVGACGAYLVLCGLVVAASYVYLAPVTEPPFRIGLSLASGFTLSIGLISFWGLLRGYASGASSRSAILARAKNDTAPIDGQVTVVHGAVRALGHPLVSPLSGTNCVAYLYNMHYYTVDAQRHRQKTPVYWGYACIPFAVDSAAARYRVMAAPELSILANTYGDEEAIQRARAFVSATQFQEMDRSVLGELQTAFNLVGKFFSDDSGEARKDWARNEDARDAKDLILEEIVLPMDTQATVIGTWSAEQNGLIPKQAKTGNIGVTVILGPPESLEQRHGMPSSLASYMATAVLMMAAGAGILYFGHYHWPH
jgi:hypothetical protein